jgi:sugar lactone lactonase YvrE
MMPKISACSLSPSFRFLPLSPSVRARWSVRFRMTFALLLILLALALPGWAQSTEVTFTGLQVSPQTNGVNPYGIAIDGTGNVYLTDNVHNVVVEVPAGSGTPVGCPVTNLNGPEGIAVDANGNVYVGDDGNTRVVKLPPGCGSQTVVPTTGLSNTINLAVDAAYNLYISDGGNNRVVKVPWTGTGYGTQTPVPTSPLSLSSPQGLAVDKTGNVYIADSGNGRVLEVPWTGTTYGAPTTVGNGLSLPWDVNLDKAGNVFIADRGNCNVVEVPTGGGAQTTVVAFPCGTGGGYRQEAQNLAIFAEGDIYTTEHYYSGGWHPPYLALVTQTDADFAWESVGQAETATLGFSFLASTTLSSITATTEGTTGLDFSVASGGSCAVGTPYVAGATCTVKVSFSPSATGLRAGAVLFTNSSSALVGVAFLRGIGAGPAIAFDSGTSTSLQATGLVSPEGTAVDAAGNVYIADSALASVVKLPWTGTGYGTQTTVGARLSGPAGVAVDGAGNVYIADSTGGTVEEVKAISGVQTSVGSGFSSPSALAADAYGNLYIADSGNNQVVELPANGSAQTTVGTGLSAPAGVAVDSIGNIYIADSGNNRVVEVPVNGSAQFTVGTGLSDPHGVAVDAALNVYIVDTGNNRLVMVPFGGSQSILLASGLNQPYGVSVDQSGNLYLANTDNTPPLVLKIDRADAPALSFPSTYVGATSNPTNVIVQNIGTQAFELNGTVGVVLDTGDVNFYFDTNTGDCVSGTQLNPGASCPIPTYFTPSKVGTLTGTITLTDNTLNATAATQMISLSGVGVAAPPTPVLSSLSPNSVTAPGAAFTLTVTGSNFVSGSIVLWNGAKLTTTYVSATELKAAVPAADVATGGYFPVTVSNPVPPVSNALIFTVNNPLPVLTSVYPSSATAPRAAFTLTVKGSNFVSDSVVQWNGANLATTYVTAKELTATVPAADVAAGGTIPVTVFNPTPDGGTSASKTFTVKNPVPTLTSVSPSSATPGGAAFTLTVTGSGFNYESIVQWNGASLTTTYVSATQLTATVPAADIATAGSFPVTVFNPPPGGGTSKAKIFIVGTNNPVPVLTSLSPDSITAGGSAFTLTVNGSNFVSGSIVKWRGTALTTTYVSATQLQAAVPASDSWTGTVSVTVFNPAPAGGTSNVEKFTINNPVPILSSLSPSSATAGGSGFTLTANGYNFVEGAVVKWNGTALTTTYLSGTQLQAAIPASDIASAGSASVTVSNPAPSPSASNALTFTIN